MATTNNVAEPPVCPHFGLCGGCAYQDVPYTEQVLRKQRWLEEQLAPLGIAEVPVFPSPRVWHYRNKIDPAFSRAWYETPPPANITRETVLGFKRKNKWYIPLDIVECRIGPEGSDALLAAVRQWYVAEGLRAWDPRSRDGVLRYLVFRDTKRTGQRMVVLITRSGFTPPPSFVTAVTALFPSASVYHATYDGKGDVARAESLQLLQGPPVLIEQICIGEGTEQRVLSFCISPFSFFQSNPLAAEMLYTAVRKWVRRLAPSEVYDLYGGCGSIALSCADSVSHVWSIESVAGASEDGARNAAQNQVNNVTFVTATVEQWARSHVPRSPESEVYILDPPRSGLHPRVIEALVAGGPRHVIYISCNPARFMQEMQALGETYAAVHAEGYDFFPHTPHVELLCILRRK